MGMAPAGSQRQVTRALRQLTLDECAQALGVRGLTPTLRSVALLPVVPLANRLARELGRFDSDIVRLGLPDAAAALLARLAVEPEVRCADPLPHSGPLFVAANHPGVYDALALFHTLRRQDLRVVANDRDFLRALPAMQPHLVYVPEVSEVQRSSRLAPARTRGLKQALAHLNRGGALLHFAAGNIEPDPAFCANDELLRPWQTGTGLLARACLARGGQVRAALVSGVHSAGLKRSRLVRLAEARGVTTLAGLLQIAFSRWVHVALRVHLGPALEAESLGGTAESATISLRSSAEQQWLSWQPPRR